MHTREFTKKLVDRLNEIFPPDQVKKEWNVAKDSGDDFNRREYYAPRVDIAVGPFNIDRRLDVNNKIIQRAVDNYKDNFLRKLYNLSHLGENREYIGYEYFLRILNKNPRCFMAIEIEKSGGAKHSFGDIVNASVMGKIGVVIPIGEKKYEMFVKLKKYFHFLKRVGKLEGDFKNVLIVEGHKLLDHLNREF